MRESSAGFTLVEVIVALFLIGLGVLAAAPMFMYAMQGNAVGGEKGEAGALAVERMEILRATDYGSLTVGGSLTVDTTGYVDTSDPDHTVRWLIEANTAPTGSLIITVRVIPAGTIPGSSREVTLTSIRGP
ncbi:MAG: prepilin-type N-terminal cleavage/methylation domain-containing protein [Acidobacteria bacterium]|nr:prepilin-type N-terminal cleavage/methylation domain-containing protein [Acidobacteriota bacterium]NIM62570.1 prepilin-type N-terminal cleavage/methylation domain-containing protein [Acidobacteriota bacterium]NIO58303.1 prepilin-type N-terminal cleavage/methylation domain-containing protein [Acidobacteriota bacterium]NIQ29359.1 prepilin-type N-terminal cleavage/methylation domain-containing protein [Acidobacteriota bacterium]NIQ83959.1 prepilin-type N-terminal cleavage/methylation domain-con